MATGLGQSHVPAVLLLSKEPPASVEQRAWWSPEMVWKLWRGGESLLLATIERQFPAVPTELTLLPKYST